MQYQVNEYKTVDRPLEFQTGDRKIAREHYTFGLIFLIGLGLTTAFGGD